MHDKSITSEVWQAATYIIFAVIVYAIYKIGQRGLDGKSPDLKTDSLVKRAFGGFAIILGIAFAAGFVFLGTSSDCSNNDDPVRGSCETTQSYEPSSTERLGTAAYWITLAGVPYLYGVYSRYKDINSGKAQKEHERELEYKKVENERINRETTASLKKMGYYDDKGNFKG